MGLIEKFFAGPINNAVNRQVQQITTNLYNQNVYQFLFDGNVIIPQDNYDYVTNGFEAVGAVYECVDLIVKKFIACPWIVYKVKDQKEYKKYLQLSQSPETLIPSLIAKAKALEEVSMPQIEDLLENPNPQFDGDATWEILAALYLLKGNAYLYGNAGTQSSINAKKWTELWAIPTTMKIKSGGFMKPIDSYIMDYYIQDLPFPADQIKHFKTLNPRYQATGQDLYGTPPLKAYLYSLDILKNADKQADKQVKNGGKMGLLTPENKEDSWSDDQMDSIDEEMKRAHKSKKQLDRYIPLSMPIKWTEIGLSSSEMQLLEIGDAKADDIYRCFHIPLQFRNQDTATYNNLPVANRQLVYNAVAPLCRRFGTNMTEFVGKAYNTKTEKYIIEKDYLGLSEMNDDLKTTAEALKNIDYLTMNEKREVLRYGRLMQDGMDSVWVNINQVRIEDVVSGKVVQGHGAAIPDNTPTPSAKEAYIKYLAE